MTPMTPPWRSQLVSVSAPTPSAQPTTTQTARTAQAELSGLSTCLPGCGRSRGHNEARAGALFGNNDAGSKRSSAQVMTSHTSYGSSGGGVHLYARLFLLLFLHFNKKLEPLGSRSPLSLLAPTPAPAPAPTPAPGSARAPAAPYMNLPNPTTALHGGVGEREIERERESPAC